MSRSLYPAIFTRWVFPSLDRLNRTSVANKLKYLDRSQWFSSSRLQEIQDAKLRDILTWTRKESDFYQRYWSSASSSLRAASSYPLLDGLPVVTKAILRGGLGSFPVGGHRGRIHVVKTSGSTGHPMTFYRTDEQESWFWALRIRMWQWAGYVPGEAYLTLNLNPRTAWKKRAQDVLFRCSYHGFNANDHDVEAVLDDLDRRKIRHLVGYASSLFLLSQAIQRQGTTNPGVSTVLSTGDTLFLSYREKIEEVFGTKVVDYYGAGGEGLHLASQCEEADAYHVHVENSVVEILRNGRPARCGETGEVVVTQLDNKAMPLIRYATGDMATLMAAEPAICPCGRQLPLIRSIEGRVPDIVLAPDGSALVVHFFTILFEHLEGIQQFQVLQTRESDITARIVPGQGYSRSSMESKIRSAVDRATHGSLAVQFEYVDDIPISDSGKRRFVISELFSAPAAVDDRLTGEVISAVPD